MEVVRTRNRKSVKAEAISSEIRKEIIDGKRELGSMLPIRDQLIEDFGISRMTLQKSMDLLINEGFIKTNGSSGSFVSDTPPHIYQIGIVVYTNIEELLVYGAILESIKEIENKTPYRFKMYRVLGGFKHQSEMEYLEEDLKCGRLAGVISFYVDASLLDEYGLLSYDTIPILILATGHSDDYKKIKKSNINYISFNYQSMIDKVIDSILLKGIKRVAWIVQCDFIYSE